MWIVLTFRINTPNKRHQMYCDCNDIYRIVHCPMHNWKPVHSSRALHTQCQWASLGRNLHNFIWIVALINCSSLSLLFYFIACILLWHSKHSFYFFMWLFLCLFFSLSPAPPPVPMLSCIWLFIDKVISLWLWVSVTLRFRFVPVRLASILFSSFLSVFQRFSFASSTALWFGSHNVSFINCATAKRKCLSIFREHFYLLLRLCHGIDNDSNNELQPHVLSRLHSREFPT